VFGTLDGPGIDRFAGRGSAVEDLSGRMMDAWLTFARTGEAPWPAYEASRRATMLFGRECGVQDAPRDEERRLWPRSASV
jgi:para-nitrobenzyl esterase